MDMDMDMGSQDTPYNINEPYANKLITIIMSILAFLTVRHISVYIYTLVRSTPQLRFVHSLLSPLALTYRKTENRIINIFSFTPFRACPPLGAVLITLTLLSAVLPLLLLNVDLAVNSNRAGFLALAIVPFLLSSTGKNSAFSFLTGISSIKMNFLHRILGFALILCATVHMACMLYAWSKFPSFMQSELQLSKVQYGLGGYACLCVVVLGSLLPVRVFRYELLLGTHTLGVGFIGAIAVHTPYAMRYFLAGLVCYILNFTAVWFVKTFVGHARCEILPEGCTKISIRLGSPMKAHHIGQHISLCIPAISPFQWHPFTITSVQQTNLAHQNSIEAFVIARGNFTRTLYNKVDPSQELSVFVSGPFGSQSIQPVDVLQSYTSVVIACGGAGVTFGMRLLRELTETLVMSLENDSSDASLLNHWKAKDIYFSWSVRRPLELEWFREELEQINYMYETHEQFPNLHIQFHITSKDMTYESNAPTVATHASSAKETAGSMNEVVELDQEPKTDTSRPYPKKEIKLIQGQRIDASSCLSVENDIGAFVCGPASFNASFKNTVAFYKSSSVYLHCEDFGY